MLNLGQLSRRPPQAHVGDSEFDPQARRLNEARAQVAPLRSSVERPMRAVVGPFEARHHPLLGSAAARRSLAAPPRPRASALAVGLACAAGVGCASGVGRPRRPTHFMSRESPKRQRGASRREGAIAQWFEDQGAEVLAWGGDGDVGGWSSTSVVQTSKGDFFMKTAARPAARMFEGEAFGLRSLKEALLPSGALAVPEVLACGDDGPGRSSHTESIPHKLKSLHSFHFRYMAPAKETSCRQTPGPTSSWRSCSWAAAL